MRFRKLIGELLRYQIAGTVIALAEAAVLFLLTDGLGVHYLLSNLLCFLLTTLLNYIFSVVFVFETDKNHAIRQELTSWLGLSVLRLGLCQLLLWLGTEALGLHYMLAKALTMLFSHFYNFFVQRLLLQKELF